MYRNIDKNINSTQYPNDEPFCPALQKYWNNLSKLEKQMQLDNETLYSLDPQQIAMETSRRIHSRCVVDAFCGAGGAAIAFARSGKRVIAIDCNSKRLQMAKNNARLFGVRKKIEFLVGDALELLPNIYTEAVYLDPPWGGPNYGELSLFRLSNFSPDGSIILQIALSVSYEVVFKLPLNFNFGELDNFGVAYEVVPNKLDDKLMYYTSFFKRIRSK